MYGASIGNSLGDITVKRFHWFFGVYPIQDRDD